MQSGRLVGDALVTALKIGIVLDWESIRQTNILLSAKRPILFSRFFHCCKFALQIKNEGLSSCKHRIVWPSTSGVVFYLNMLKLKLLADVSTQILCMGVSRCQTIGGSLNCGARDKVLA